MPLITPNRVTMLRIILCPIVMYLVWVGSILGALVLFTVAVITDFYDGYLARKQNLITSAGSFLDPLADKVLVLGLFSVLYVKALVPMWVLASIVLRDVIVTLLRSYTARTGSPLSTTWFAKVKTALQFGALYFVLLELLLETAYGGFLTPLAFFLTRSNRMFLLTITALITLLSTWSYFVQSYKRLWLSAQQLDQEKNDDEQPPLDSNSSHNGMI